MRIWSRLGREQTHQLADMAKLADAPDLGSGGAIHVGSTPIIRTFEYRTCLPAGGQGTRNPELRSSLFLVPCSLLKNKLIKIYNNNGNSRKRKHRFIK